MYGTTSTLRAQQQRSHTILIHHAFYTGKQPPLIQVL
jgi:hypothetical protein